MKRLLFCSFFIWISITSACFANQEKILSIFDQETVCTEKECYRIVRYLGEGVFGSVFEVEDSNGRPFALKSYKLMEDTGKFWNVFYDSNREFRRGQELDHPHIIKSFDEFIYESAKNQKTNNIVLELVRGQTLFKTKRKFLSREEALEQAIRFSEALSYALSQNMLHLDLHDNNVMINENGQLMIIDLASFFSLDEILDFVAKTATKKSAEKARNQKVDAGLDFVEGPEPVPAPQNAPIRAAKLEKFFQDNPQLLQQFELMIENKEMSAFSGAKKDFNLRTFLEKRHARLFANYFERITETSSRLLMKSTMDRSEKLQLRSEIKKLSWDYSENVEEGIYVPFEDYLNKLMDLLQSA